MNKQGHSKLKTPKMPNSNLIFTPTLMMRMKSMFIDSLVIIILMYFFTVILDKIGIESTALRLAAAALVILYEPICTTINRTIGQAMIGIRVKSFKALTENGVSQNISFMSALFRFALKIVLGMVSFVTVHSDPYGRAMHDKAVDSIMILD